MERGEGERERCKQAVRCLVCNGVSPMMVCTLTDNLVLRNITLDLKKQQQEDSKENLTKSQDTSHTEFTDSPYSRFKGSNTTQ